MGCGGILLLYNTRKYRAHTRMTILKKLIAILGQFWFSICSTSLPGVLCRILSGIFAGIFRHRQQDIVNSCAAQTRPFVHKTSMLQLQMLVRSVRPAELPVTSVTAQQLASAMYTGTKSTWWVVQLVNAPHMRVHVIQDKNVAPDVVLLAGIDFYIQNSLLYINRDPSTLDFATQYTRITQTQVQIVYVAPGICLELQNTYNAFDFITGTRRDLYRLRDALWRIRVQGLTQSNIKSVCAQQLGITAAHTNQPVLAVQQAYGYWYVYTGSICYRCTAKPVVSAGYVLSRGQALCGQLSVYTCRSYKKCTALKQLQVSTPVGMLQAVNSDIQCIDEGILPLQDTRYATYAAYADYIKNMYPSYTSSGIHGMVNTCAFIVDRLFRGSFILLALTAAPTVDKLRALQVRLRRQCPADSIIYILDLTTGKARLLYSIIQEI